MKSVARAFFALAFAMALFAHPAPAKAATAMTICNRTADPIYASYGYFTSGVDDSPGSNVLTGPFVSQGLWTIAPAKCVTLSSNFNGRYMFWWAYSLTGLNTHGSVWSTNSNVHYCMPDVNRDGPIKAFTFEDENASSSACTRSSTDGIANAWVPVRKVDVVRSPSFFLISRLFLGSQFARAETPATGRLPSPRR
jgi:uncharacterized membrane protein